MGQRQRPEWNSYFMDMALLVSKRSACLRRQVGAVIVKDKMIVSTGYNGPPRGYEHCTDEPNQPNTCVRLANNIPSGQDLLTCMAVHAEQNAIVQAAKTGTSIDGSVMYSTTYPCSICMKMIANVGIRIVYYMGDYNDNFSIFIASRGNIKLIKV